MNSLIQAFPEVNSYSCAYIMVHQIHHNSSPSDPLPSHFNLCHILKKGIYLIKILILSSILFSQILSPPGFWTKILFASLNFVTCDHYIFWHLSSHMWQLVWKSCNNIYYTWEMNLNTASTHSRLPIRGCIQKFPDWLPGARTENCTTLCHKVQLYHYFVSQSREFCHHNPLCCFPMSVFCCLFHYDSVQKLLDIPSYIPTCPAIPRWWCWFSKKTNLLGNKSYYVLPS
jgi:hypothetical protein